MDDLLKKQREVSSEHLVLDDDGKLKGLYRVDPMKRLKNAAGKEGIWNLIDDLMKTYELLHPNEMKILKIENKVMAEDKSNKHGSTKDKSKRHTCSIPVGLMTLLEQVEPRMFVDKKKLHTLLKRYPYLKTCEKL